MELKIDKIKRVLLVLLVLTGGLFNNLFGQNIGINGTGATPDVSAMLDIAASDKGILLPRVALTSTTDITTVSAAAISLLVYNTSTILDVTPGFYYWDGVAWVKLNTGVGGANTLDQAYDQGGVGAGRQITADNGSLRVNGTDGLMVTGGTIGSGAVDEVTGFGTRMFFNPNKAAFRAGYITPPFSYANVWNDVNIGVGSFAVGHNVEASGDASIAMGNTIISSGKSSIALGEDVIASGDKSVAMGDGTIASGNNTVAIGGFNTATGFGSLALGIGTTSTGVTSTSMGNNTIASGNYSIAMGGNTTAESTYETVIGQFNTSGGGNATTWIATDRLFVVGNGTASGSESDAMVILKNGNIGIGNSTPGATLDLLGTLQYVDGNEGAGKILTSDATGNATWQVASGGSNWDLTGNAGTTSGTNFIGTTDAQALDLRTNNVIKARLTTKGQLEFLNTGSSVFIGEGAGTNDDLTNNRNVFLGSFAGNINTTGGNNTATGFGALMSNNGNNNTANGYGALQFNTTGNSNTAIGLYSLQVNLTGSNNMAIGQNSLFSNVSGSDNMAIGFSALSANANGNFNVAVGANAGFSCLGSRNVFLGADAGSNETGDNKLYIENSPSITPLIYGEFDTDLIRINGTLNINNVYSFPLVDGAANEVLTTNGAGNVAWASSSGWGLTGNAGTTSGTNFIGTTDAQALDFRANNIIQARITIKGQLEFPSNGNSVFIGNAAGASDDLSNNLNVFIGANAGNSNTSGNNNIANGTNALYLNTIGVHNVAIGRDALRDNISGNYNTATGSNALSVNTSNKNSAYGNYAMASNTAGGENTAIGSNSLQLNTIGDGNTALGFAAGYSSTGTGNVYLGFRAGYFEVGSNKLYIENSNSITPLIYGEFDNDLVRVNGDLDVVGDISLSGQIIQEALQTPTLIVPWVNFAGFEPSGYYKDKEGRVHLSGLVANGGVGTILFTLPVGYRPAARRVFTSIANGAICRIDVDINGDVVLISATSTVYVSLECISFRP